MRAHVLMSLDCLPLLPRCQCQCHCDFMRPALSRYHPHPLLHQNLILLPVQLTADGAVVPLVPLVSQFAGAPSRFTFACERLRGPRLPASFDSPQCYQFGSMLCCRLVLLRTRLACQWQQHCHYWGACTSRWYRIRCLVASDIGMTLSVADGLPCVVSLRPSGHGWVSCLLPSGLAHVAGHLVLSSVQPIF